MLHANNDCFFTKIKNNFHKFFTSTKAIITVEFAVYAPIFVLTIILCITAIKVQATSIALEQSIYIIAQKARLSSGKDFDSAVQTVLAEKINGFFAVEQVVVTPTYADSLSNLVKNPITGAGESQSLVCIDLKANISLFPYMINFYKNYSYSNKYCYQNEIEDIE